MKSPGNVKVRFSLSNCTETKHSSALFYFQANDSLNSSATHILLEKLDGVLANSSNISQTFPLAAVPQGTTKGFEKDETAGPGKGIFHSILVERFSVPFSSHPCNLPVILPCESPSSTLLKPW